MDKKTIIFDFDGTIADSMEIMFELANQLSGRFGYRQIEKSEIEGMRGKSAQELLKKFNVSYLKVPFILREGKKLFAKKLDELKMFPQVKEQLQELHEKGFQLGIITSNSEKNTKKFLQINEVDLFDFVFCEKGYFKKARKIEKVVLKNKMQKKNVAYVGDEVRDIEAAKKSGVKSVVVCWGFNSRQALEKHNPDVFVEKPSELAEKIESLF